MDREAMIAALIFGGSGSGGGGGADAPLVVTFSQSGSNWSCDTSGDDIKAAVAAGKSVYGIAATDYIFQLTFCTKNSNAIEFSTVKVSDTPAKTVVWTLSGGKMASVWIWKSSERPLPPAIANGDTEKILSVSSGSDGTVEWRADKGTPFYVNFTITGQPVGNVYPLSADKTLAEIDAAIDAGYDVIGTCNLGGSDTPCARIASIEYGANDDLAMVAFYLIGFLNSALTYGVIRYNSNGALLSTLPLSTAQMTYDSATQTLAIFDPLA